MFIITSVYVISYLQIFTNLSRLYKFHISCLYKSFSFINSSVQIFQVELEILWNSSTIFSSSHWRCSIKKLLWNILWYLQENTCVGVSFLSRQACNFIEKRLQHRYFLVNIGKFIRTPILKNICEWLLLHFWKVFCKNIFQIIT